MQCMSPKSQKGFNLIESMIATLIISVGLLGVAGMQILAMKGTGNAFQQGQASNFAKGLLEKMRSNPQGVFDGNYIADSSDKIQFPCVNLAKNCEDGVTDCNAEELAKSDLYFAVCGYDNKKSGSISTMFSSGKFEITCPTPTTCEDQISLVINWDERSLGDDGSLIPREISLDTVITR